MKKFILAFIVINFRVLFPQTIDISFTVSDGYETGYWLKLGLDSTATDGIDPQLGEMELPAPAPGYFWAAFDLFPYIGSVIYTYRDYRNAPSFPFTGTKEHTLGWGLSPGGTEFTLFYDFPIGAYANIKDQFGGIFFNHLLTDSGSYAIPYSDVLHRAILTMYYNNIGGEPTNEPVFSMSPISLNFGEVAFGESETLPVLIANVGYLDSLSITNAVSFDPAFSFEPNTFPIILAPGQPQIFNITYTGTIEGEHIDSILFYHNASGSPSKLNVFAETFSQNPNCVAQVLCDVTISGGGIYDIKQLNFGLDSTATDDIDPQLGEMELPPIPPPGSFDARFFLPENNFSGTSSAYCDFRFTAFPFTGQKEWRLAYQANFGDAITISWDFPEYMTGTLLDIVNGTFINEQMVGLGSYTVTDPVTFNRLRMIIDFNITTPVELISFTAEVLENAVELNWSSATETNNQGFEIERGLPQPLPKEGAIQTPLPLGKGQGDGLWETIGFVPGFGTTSEPKSYSFIDENVITGIYKYRLKQIDFDGTFTYSNEIEVEVDFTPKEFVLYQNYPNPFNPSTMISWQSPVSCWQTLIIFDVLGNEVVTLINEYRPAGKYEVEFSTKGGPESSIKYPASGVYFYKLTVGEFTQVRKMVLLR